MVDTDTLLMNRAFVLARQGAGLVSPNPMVGAVLINDGEIVGEGFHRYDLLKHAEAYAIETAGDRARGATLYCNLEPCCHYGRTPPCTDSLKKAGIARAVIAVKDSDPRVNGRGIEQLQQAGIEVDVGLLEERALRLNEIYFKFITSGAPFVHGVIEYQSESSSGTDWHPSSEFVQAISEYDALMIGDRIDLNRLVLDRILKHKPYRPLVVAVREAEPWLTEGFSGRIAAGEMLVIEFGPNSITLGGSGKVVSIEEELMRDDIWSDFGTLKSRLTKQNVSSLLILPGARDSRESSNFVEYDKATLVIPGPLPATSAASRWSYGDVEFDLEEVSIAEADGFTELTGYPSVREVA